MRRLLLFAIVIHLKILQCSSACTFPATYQNPNIWWYQYSDGNIFSKIFSTNTYTQYSFPAPDLAFTCYDSYTDASGYFYFIHQASLVPTVFCCQSYLVPTNNVLLIRTTIAPSPPGINGNAQADCAPRISPNEDFEVHVKYPFEFEGSTCPFPAGKHQATLIQSAGVNECEGDITSTITVSGDSITLNTCYSGTTSWRQPFKSKFQCLASMKGGVLDFDYNGDVLILADVTEGTSARPLMYCARYRIEADKYYLSIQIINNNEKAICRPNSNYQTVNDNAKAFQMNLCKSDTYYKADPTNHCFYYDCTTRRACPPGTAVPDDYIEGDSAPCTKFVNECGACYFPDSWKAPKTWQRGLRSTGLELYIFNDTRVDLQYFSGAFITTDSYYCVQTTQTPKEATYLRFKKTEPNVLQCVIQKELDGIIVEKSFGYTEKETNVSICSTLLEQQKYFRVLVQFPYEMPAGTNPLPDGTFHVFITQDKNDPTLCQNVDSNIIINGSKIIMDTCQSEDSYVQPYKTELSVVATWSVEAVGGSGLGGYMLLSHTALDRFYCARYYVNKNSGEGYISLDVTDNQEQIECLTDVDQFMSGTQNSHQYTLFTITGLPAESTPQISSTTTTTGSTTSTKTLDETTTTSKPTTPPSTTTRSSTLTTASSLETTVSSSSATSTSAASSTTPFPCPPPVPCPPNCQSYVDDLGCKVGCYLCTTSTTVSSLSTTTKQTTITTTTTAPTTTKTTTTPTTTPKCRPLTCSSDCLPEIVDGCEVSCLCPTTVFTTRPTTPGPTTPGPSGECGFPESWKVPIRWWYGLNSNQPMYYTYYDDRINLNLYVGPDSFNVEYRCAETLQSPTQGEVMYRRIISDQPDSQACVKQTGVDSIITHMERTTNSSTTLGECIDMLPSIGHHRVLIPEGASVPPLEIQCPLNTGVFHASYSETLGSEDICKDFGDSIAIIGGTTITLNTCQNLNTRDKPYKSTLTCVASYWSPKRVDNKSKILLLRNRDTGDYYCAQIYIDDQIGMQYLSLDRSNTETQIECLNMATYNTFGRLNNHLYTSFTFAVERPTPPPTSTQVATSTPLTLMSTSPTDVTTSQPSGPTVKTSISDRTSIVTSPSTSPSMSTTTQGATAPPDGYDCQSGFKYLPHKDSACFFYMCMSISEPKLMACQAGRAVPATFWGGNSNPCMVNNAACNQCQFKDHWKNKWWFDQRNESPQIYVYEDNKVTLQLTGNINYNISYTCVPYMESAEEVYFLRVRFDIPTDIYCVRMQGIEGALIHTEKTFQSNESLESCFAELKLNDHYRVLLPYPLDVTVGSACPFAWTSYHVWYSDNPGSEDLCRGNKDSVLRVSGDRMIFRTCQNINTYNQPYQTTMTCVTTWDMLDQEKGSGRNLVLAYDNPSSNVTGFYCARYYSNQLTGTQYLSIDRTSPDLIECLMNRDYNTYGLNYYHKYTRFMFTELPPVTAPPSTSTQEPTTSAQTKSTPSNRPTSASPATIPSTLTTPTRKPPMSTTKATSTTMRPRADDPMIVEFDFVNKYDVHVLNGSERFAVFLRPQCAIKAGVTLERIQKVIVSRSTKDNQIRLRFIILPMSAVNMTQRPAAALVADTQTTLLSAYDAAKLIRTSVEDGTLTMRDPRNFTLYVDRDTLTINVDGACPDQACLNGKCRLMNDTYKCICNKGYTGTFCEQKITDPMEQQEITTIIILVSVLAGFIIVAVIIALCLCHYCRNRELEPLYSEPGDKSDDTLTQTFRRPLFINTRTNTATSFASSNLRESGKASSVGTVMRPGGITNQINDVDFT